MDLQLFYRQKIDEYGGINHFLKHLNRSRRFFPPEYQYHIDEIRVYFSMVYSGADMDIEGDVVKYRDRIKSANRFFRAGFKEAGDLFCNLMLVMNETALGEQINVRNIV